MLKSNYELKREFQDWLNKYKFSHCIVVEPTPKQYFKLDEIKQRLRKVNFDLNKHFLKSKWSKWRSKDKFWWVGFREGNEFQRNFHYHFLLYSPPEVYRNEHDFTRNRVKDIILNKWRGIKSINHHTFANRLDLSDILHISQVTDNSSSVYYSSKKYNPINDNDNLIFVN